VELKKRDSYSNKHLATFIQVFALEISPGFLKLLRDLVARESLGRTNVLEATHTDTNLPAGVRVDLALLIDVYHHGALG
jgi:hypothetical protein